MQYRHEIEHAPANLASAKGRTVFIDEARSDAVWVYNWGHAPASLAMRGEGLYSLMKLAPMQYGSIRGGTLPLTSPS